MTSSKPIVFLDIDGVLNSEDWVMRRPGNLRGAYRELDPDACARLQKVTDMTGAELVITSSRRKINTIPQIRAMLEKRGVTAKIIGRTPSLDAYWKDPRFEEPWSRIGRGLEVQWWLQHFLGDKGTCEAKFVCLDDDSDYGDLLGKLVQTRHALGLCALECDHAVKHLSETLMESRASGGPGRVFFKYDTHNLDPWWSNQEGPFGPA